MIQSLFSFVSKQLHDRTNTNENKSAKFSNMVFFVRMMEND